MTKKTMTGVCACVFACGLLAATTLTAETDERRDQMRTVLVAAVQKDGTPVADLKAEELVVKVDGKVREVIDATRATTPMRVAMLIADGGTGAFQQGMVGLLQRMQGEAEFSIVSVLEAPEKIVDYTKDVDALVAGIQRLGQRTNRQVSGQLMEAIVDAASTVSKPGQRSAIVVMRTGGAAVSPTRADVVREMLRKNGTRLYVLAPRGSGGPGGSVSGGGGGAMGQARSDFAASESASRGRDLEIVLNDGSKESGGRYEQISSQTLAAMAQQIADELLAQYEVSYVLPDGVKPSDRLEVTTSRKDIRLHAPTRVAN